MNPQEALALLAPGLEAERAPLKLEDIADMLARHEQTGAILYSGQRSAIFTWVEACADGELVLHVGPAGGDLDEILAALPVLEARNRERGITQIMIEAGRQGWTRALKPYGYDHYSTILRKLL